MSLSPKSRMNRIVVSTEPTSTMNITGLRIIVRGLSFLIESSIAVVTIAGSKIDLVAESLVRTFGGRWSSGEMVAVMRVCVLTVRGVRGSGPARAPGRT